MAIIARAIYFVPRMFELLAVRREELEIFAIPLR
jgi:hypothetical protein